MLAALTLLWGPAPPPPPVLSLLLLGRELLAESRSLLACISLLTDADMLSTLLTSACASCCRLANEESSVERASERTDICSKSFCTCRATQVSAKLRTYRYAMAILYTQRRQTGQSHTG